MDKIKLIHNFLKTQIHMVIATSTNDGKPEAALVGFANADDLSLIFGTYTTTRKYQNIQVNSKVALVFGNKEGVTIQYEGMTSVLSGNELTKYKQIYFKKTPSSKKYENHEDQIYLKIQPSWIRYTDYNKKPI